MFTKQELKTNLMGCLDIFLFMPSGIDRFSSAPRDAMRSLVIPLGLMPVILVVMAMMSQGVSLTLLISLNTLRIGLSFVLFLTAVYFLTKHFGREAYFYKFLNVSNWINIPGLILLLPIVIGLFMGYEMKNMESYAVFISLVGYVYSAFVITHCFRLPWELGGFIAIIGLAIDDNSFKILEMVKTMVTA